MATGGEAAGPLPDAAGLVAELEQIEPLPRVDLDGAERRVERALVAARALGIPELVRRTQLVQADVLERRGRVADSGRIAHEVHRWAQEHGDRHLLARSHYVLEAVFSDLGDVSLALEHAVRAVDLLDESAPATVRFDHLARLADCVALNEALESARERYPEVLRLAEDLGDLDRQLLALNNWAYFEAGAGNFAQALELSNRMQALAATGGVVLHAGRLDTVARALMGLGRFSEAERIMLPALDPEVVRDIPDGDAGAVCLLTLAEIQRSLGQLERAQATLEECLRQCQENGLTGVAAGARREQAALQAAQGRFAEAYASHQRFHNETMALQSEQRDARARALHAMYETTEARQQSRRYRELSLRDPLTGLYNRRYVDEQLPDLLRRTAEQVDVLTVALLDLDHFKRVNDTYSHKTGDQVLQVVAELLETAVARAARTPPAFAARMGGEEFLVVLPAHDAGTAAEVLEQLRLTIGLHPWAELVGGLPVTVSIGAASATGADASTVASLLSRADSRLYTAKRAGRDRVVSDASG